VATNANGAPGIAVLDYGIGNLRSAEKALQHLGAPARLVDDPDVARRASAVVLPGVGAFGPCMDALRASGLEPVVRDAVDAGKPFLGVCIGMQMLFDESDEASDVKGLGIIRGGVRRLPKGVKIPHMGWNTVAVSEGSGLFAGLGDAPWLYFVHSFAPDPADSAVVAGVTEYGGPICAAVEQGSVWATQFHPEKSSDVGLAVLANFVRASGF
jgi:glutamine amidotransferase